jgi:DNA-binding CsgD family transcriptional regulator
MGRAGLLERDNELAIVDRAIEDAVAGRGASLAIEAAAGLGKTRLLETATERASGRGLRVLSARGFELEREFTFGVLRQLFEAAVTGGDDPLLEGPAAPAAPAIGAAGGAPVRGADPAFAVAHAVYWLTTNLAQREPLVLALDDAHWADTASLRCLVYLAARLDGLPLLLVTARRTGEPEAPDDLLDALAGPGRMELAPLGAGATGLLLAGLKGEEPAESFVAAAHGLTGGNPFYVTALATDLRDEGVRPDESGARGLPAVTPRAVARSVLVRLTRMGREATALAQAVAVLGDGAALGHVAALAGLDVPQAAAVADRLAGADVLQPGQRLAFTHPLVREAVHAETPPHGRSVLHAGAARLLHDSGASAEQVAAHLLRTTPGADAWTAARLADAGEAAVAGGDPDSGVTFLRRALEEPPPRAERARVLHGLGGAELRVGDAVGYEHMEQALHAATDRARRAAIGFDQARGLLLAGRPGALDALQRAAAELPAGERAEAVEKETELIALGRMTPATAPLVRERTRQLAVVAEREEPGWPAVLGALAGNAYLDNRPATEVAALARRSLEARRAQGDDPAESAGYLDSCFVLHLAGEYAEAERHLDHAVDSARRANALIGFAAAASFRAASALKRGDLAAAEADARMAIEAAGTSNAPLPLPATVGTLVEVLIERDRIDEADALLAEQGFDGELLPLGPFNDLAFARGRLRLAEGRAEEAAAELTGAGRAAQALGIEAPGPFPWRPYAALALGRTREGRAMVDEGVAVARAFGAPRDLGIALRAAGVVHRDDAGIELLREAVEVLEGSGALLELARARTELGGALRRAGRREAARDALREALDGASRCGAGELAAKARAELVAAGAKPRRERSSGIDALTASERRVADLARQGLTNRQIAESLFVTTKTVEKHLASAYGKLAIGGRAGLAAAFET